LALNILQKEAISDRFIAALIVLTFFGMAVSGAALHDEKLRDSGIYGLLPMGSGYLVGVIYSRAKTTTGDMATQMHKLFRERDVAKQDFETLKQAFKTYMDELEKITTIPKPPQENQ